MSRNFTRNRPRTAADLIGALAIAYTALAAQPDAQAQFLTDLGPVAEKYNPADEKRQKKAAPIRLLQTQITDLCARLLEHRDGRLNELAASAEAGEKVDLRLLTQEFVDGAGGGLIVRVKKAFDGEGVEFRSEADLNAIMGGILEAAAAKAEAEAANAEGEVAELEITAATDAEDTSGDKAAQDAPTEGEKSETENENADAKPSRRKKAGAAA